MPFRQREEIRGAHLGVIPEPEQRFAVSFANIVTERLLEGVLRRLQVAEQERNKAENPPGDASLCRAPFGFSLPKEGLGSCTRFSMFATHEAGQTLTVVCDETRRGFVRRSDELASARIGRAHFVGGEPF